MLGPEGDHELTHVNILWKEMIRPENYCIIKMGEPDNKQKSTVGQGLKLIRQRNGWTLEDVASKLGISIPALSKIETGVTDVNLSRLEQIANIYGVTLLQLLNIYNEDLQPIEFNSDILKKKLTEQEEQISALQRKVIELYDELYSRK
jgi:transcriptional regulator with XRE-family HTH domain